MESMLAQRSLCQNVSTPCLSLGRALGNMQNTKVHNYLGAFWEKKDGGYHYKKISIPSSCGLVNLPVATVLPQDCLAITNTVVSHECKLVNTVSLQEGTHLNVTPYVTPYTRRINDVGVIKITSKMSIRKNNTNVVDRISVLPKC